ncbi:histidine kinase [Rhodospirillum rubrum]|nr:histidine kinase [Rhodospirillum rubrum]MBK1676106.1 histidine kinase [Rhodospirillum rubrum]
MRLRWPAACPLAAEGPIRKAPMTSAQAFAQIEDGVAFAQAIVDTIREPLLVLDKDLRVVCASRAFYQTFKLRPEDVAGCPLYRVGEGQWNIPELRVLLETILPQHAVMDAYEIDHDFGESGHHTMVLNARTVVNEGKGERLILLAMEDVTVQRAAEAAMRDLLAEKDVLLQEMRHRVGNSLQLIASILLMKARAVSSEETRHHLQDAHQRILSIAAAQQQLQASRHGEAIALAPYLGRLCETLTTTLIGDARPIVVRVAADGSAPSNEAASLGLIVTELVINALKHAFLADATTGEILVAYESAAAGGAWRLSVSDNGVGTPTEGAAKVAPGLGTSIIQALGHQLDARIEIVGGPRGTRVSLTHGVFAPPPVAAS